MVRERRYIDKLSGMLPDDIEIKQAVELVRSFVDGKLRDGDNALARDEVKI
jgi:hypothetical protein